MKLVNISNHPSAKWTDEQKKGWEEIIDIPFPQVSPYASADEIINTASEIFLNFVNKFGLNVLKSDYVFYIAGEFTLFFYLVRLLLASGLTVVIATTERRAIERIKEDGTTEKTTIFEFVRWRSIE